MNIKTRYFLIYIFLFVLSLSSSAQDFRKADSLFQDNHFLEASIEYARTSFYSKDITLQQEASYRRALCYRFMNESDKAIKELDRVNLFRANPDFRVKIIYERILNAFIQKDYNQVNLSVNKLKFFEKDYSRSMCILPTYILSLNSLRKWDQAKEVFSDYVEASDISDDRKKEAINSIDSIYCIKNIPKKYSSETAENWSRFIPGAGHMYSGNITEGLFAFGLCAGFAFIGGYEIYYKYYFTGYVFGFGLLHKSYFGGMRRASYLADRKNDEVMNLFNKRCVELLIKINS